MNPSVNNTQPVQAAQATAINKPRSVSYLPVAVLPVYFYVLYGSGLGGPAAALLSVVGYFTMLYLYYGIARLAHGGRTELIWIGSLLAVAAATVPQGLDNILPVLLILGVLVSGSVICGRMTASGKPPGRVYLVSAAAVAGFAAVLYYPIWSEIAAVTPEITETASADLERVLVSLGYSGETVRESIAQTTHLFEAVVRVTPALTIMSAVLQFSLGYLLFVRVTQRENPSSRVWVPFTQWRIPFGFTPVVVVTILVRFLAGEPLVMIADNVMLGLALFYSVAGLALVEYYLGRLSLPWWGRLLFYVALLLSMHVGFILAAVLGFIDSFFDWRNRPQAEAADST